MRAFIFHQIYPENQEDRPSMVKDRATMKNHIGSGMWHPVGTDIWMVFSRRVNEKFAIVYLVKEQEVWGT